MESGRLHRAHPGKTSVRVHDYLDTNLPLTLSMWRKRSPAYRELGYEIVHTGEELAMLE